MILENIKMHLSKAILLKDAFSEETVTNGMQIKISHGGKTVLKPGGYCLFLNMEQEEFEVEIESPIYRHRTVRLKADGGRQAEEIFLYPSEGYPVRAGSTWICGTAPSQAALWFHLEDGAEESKLLSDFHKGEERISIFKKGKADHGKKNWYIRDKEKKAGEYFQAREIPGVPEEYELLRPLEADYRKKNAVLYPAFTYITDETGELYLLLPHLKEQKYTLYYSYEKEGTTICGKTEIQGRKQNTQYF